MPRDTFDIREFGLGIISSNDRADLPKNSATWIADADPEAAPGELRQRRYDGVVSSNEDFSGIINGCTIRRNDAKYDVLFYQNNAVHSPAKQGVFAIQDFGTSETGTPVDVDPIGAITTPVTFNVSNEEVRCGYGNTVDTPSRWYGYIRQDQFGVPADSTIHPENAACAAPLTFPTMYKTFVWAQSGTDYLYGISWQGTRLYKVRISDGQVTTSHWLFKSTQGICDIRSQNYLYLWDENGANGLGTLYKISKLTLEVYEKYTLLNVSHSGSQPTPAGLYRSYDSAENTAWISDIEETTSHVVFALHKRADRQTFTGGGWGRSHWTVGDTEGVWSKYAVLSIPKSGLTSGSTFVAKDTGWYYDGSVASDGDVLTTGFFGTALRCLYRSSLATEVGVIGVWNGTLNNSGVVPEFCVVMFNDTHMNQSDPVASNVSGSDFRIRGLTSSGFVETPVPVAYAVRGANSTIVDMALQENTSNIVNTDIQKVGVFLADDLLISASAWSGASPVTTTFTAGYALTKNPAMINTSIAYQGVGGTNEDRYVIVSEWTEENDMDEPVYFTIEQYYRASSGKLMTEDWNYVSVTWGGPEYVKHSQVWIELSDATSPVGVGPMATGGTHLFYRISYIYDDLQESPLSEAVWKATVTATNSKLMKVLCFTNQLSKRITGINVYRAESAPAEGNDVPTGFYRLVMTYPCNIAWSLNNTENTTWGDYSYYDEYDIGKYGVSYETNTGIGESVTDTGVNYKLQATGYGFHFVADCFCSFYDDATHMIFRSKENAYDVFDVANDYLRLPTVPTALAIFNGYLYAFDESRMYKINYTTMQVEDITDGIGAIGPESVLVTDYGMFTSDANTVWLHAGEAPQPIGNVIKSRSQTVYGTSYGELVSGGYRLQVLPWVIKNMIVFLFTKAAAAPVLYLFSVRFRSWFSYSIANFASSSPLSASGATGGFGDPVRQWIYVSCAPAVGGYGKLQSSTGATNDYSGFTYYTQDLDFGDASQDKRLYGIFTEGSGLTVTYAKNGTTDFNAFSVVGDKFKSITVKAVAVEDDAGTDVLRSVSIMYRTLEGKRAPV